MYDVRKWKIWKVVRKMHVVGRKIILLKDEMIGIRFELVDVGLGRGALNGFLGCIIVAF